VRVECEENAKEEEYEEEYLVRHEIDEIPL
jgi:hypothetical protein